MATKDEKTEDATGRRKEEAKKKGDVPRSKDLSAAVGLMLTLLFFSLSIPSMGRIILASFKIYFNNAGSIRMTETSMYFVGKDIFITFLKLTGPLFILLFFIAVAMEMIYAGGIQILGERLKIKWEKVFFLPEIPKGLKKILISTEALMDLFKSIVKVIVVAFIAYHTIRIYIPVVMELPQTSMENILVVMGRIFARLTFNITLFFLALALLDYIWQMHRHK
ncbi:MAG: EscU/YscU/HrcU family type III secretion system export apparatus switch protein, partial [bacterium]|nr:EscU/YscU/HrcU family type III secretion system export apparatus switch protein [bacterium]